MGHVLLHRWGHLQPSVLVDRVGLVVPHQGFSIFRDLHPPPARAGAGNDALVVRGVGLVARFVIFLPLGGGFEAGHLLGSHLLALVPGNEAFFEGLLFGEFVVGAVEVERVGVI